MNDLQDLSIPFNGGRIKPHYRLHNGLMSLSNAPAMKYGLSNLIFASPLETTWKSELLFALNETASLDESKLLMKAFLRRMRRLTEQSGARFAVVLAPAEEAEYPVGQNYYDWYNEVMVEQGYSFLDFRSILDRHHDQTIYFQDGVHYSPIGNDLLAQQVYLRLIRRP